MATKKKPVFRSMLNADELRVPGQKFTRPSKTQPDQTLTIKQIMDRFASGQHLNVGRMGGEFEGDDDDLDFDNLPDPSTLDFAEVQSLREAAIDEMNYINQKAAIDRQTKAKDQQQKQKTIDDQLKRIADYEKALLEQQKFLLNNPPDDKAGK